MVTILIEFKEIHLKLDNINNVLVDDNFLIVTFKKNEDGKTRISYFKLSDVLAYHIEKD